MHRAADWPQWLAAAQVTTIDGNSGLKFENSALAYQAAIDELGIVMAQRAFVEDDLRTGRLVAPLPLRGAHRRTAYYLAYPKVAQRFAADPGLRGMDRPGNGADGRSRAVALAAP